MCVPAWFAMGRPVMTSKEKCRAVFTSYILCDLDKGHTGDHIGSYKRFFWSKKKFVMWRGHPCVLEDKDE